jgi:flagellar assembly factor FliW
MDILTTRFGKVAIEADEILLFPHGLMGFEDCQHWVLLADAVNPTVGWLQSIVRSSLAMPVISPRRFVPQYQLRVTRGELASLQLGATDRTYVLSLVSEHEGALTTNLKAPVVINLARRLGKQVVTSDEQSLRYELARKTIPLRKTA